MIIIIIPLLLFLKKEMVEINDSVLLKINYDTSDAEQSINDLGDALDKAGKKDLGEQSVKSLKAQLKEARDAALALQQAGKMDTKAYADAVRTIAELRDEQDVLNRTLTAFDPGNRYNAFIGVAQTAAGAVQGAAGAMAVLGVNSENATEIIARLNGIMAFTDAINQIGDLQDYWKGWVLQLQASRAARQADVAATQAQTVATNTATVSTNLLTKAMIAIPIILVVGALTLLVQHWDKVKESVTKLFPALKDTSSIFNELKQVAFGVGNVILQYVTTPIRALIKVIQGDFKAAVNEVKTGFDVVKNYTAGANKEAISQAEDAAKKKLEISIKSRESEIAIVKAKGKDTYELEKKLFQDKLKLYKKDSDDYKKTLQEFKVFEAGHIKELADERKKESDKKVAAAKTELDKIKELEKEALAQVFNIGKNAKDIELNALTAKFNEQKALYQKYGKDITNITKVYNAEKNAVEAKYAEDINNYLSGLSASSLNEFEAKKKKLEDEINQLMKNATPEQKERLQDALKTGKDSLDVEKRLSNNSLNANSNLADVEANNTIDDSDTPETARAKVEAVRLAQIDAENAAFELTKIQKQGEKEQLEALEREHNNKLNKINKDASKTRADIDKAEKEAKLNNLTTIGGALTSFSAIFKKQSAAAKATAIAGATIDTYVGINKALAASPPPFNFVAAAAVGAAGFANVKNILSTSEGSSPVASTPTALSPVINSTVISGENQVQDVRLLNPENIKVEAVVQEKALDKSIKNIQYKNSSAKY